MKTDSQIRLLFLLVSSCVLIGCDDSKEAVKQSASTEVSCMETGETVVAKSDQSFTWSIQITLTTDSVPTVMKKFKNDLCKRTT